MNRTLNLTSACALGLSLVLLACISDGTSARGGERSGRSVNYAMTLPPPMDLAGSAHEAALSVPLDERVPTEFPGLHNVFFLSEDIVSGSEPDGARGLAELQALGVRTIVSVDGKEPDAQAAEALGMRYVHVPIQYSGVSESELARITKTFRELEGPFYVHCFHGKHRGPAAAAIGRIVLDGASRETAIGEMKQYCGTSDKYEGLYRQIAVGPLPAPEETERLDYAFDAIRRPQGTVGVMVQLSRAHDNLVVLAEHDWGEDPDHPDIVALNEAIAIENALTAAQDLGSVRAAPSDMRDWYASSLADAKALATALRKLDAGVEGSGAQAAESFKRLKQTCSACHAAYRN